MVLALVLGLAIVGQPISPALPKLPSPEEIEAAAALFPREPYTFHNNGAINLAAAQLSGEALDARGARTTERDFALAERLRVLARRGEAQIIDEAIRCLAEPWAQKLSVEDLQALRTFIATPPGRRFWQAHMQGEPWSFCFKRPVAKYLGPVLDAEVDKVIVDLPKP